MIFFSAMNIPNVITLIRMLLVPVLIYLLLHGDYTGALWVFLAAGVSDALDGFIAKRFNMCTRLGALLDPLADKFLLVSSVIVLALQGHLPWWLALIIVARDIIIVGGAGAFYLRSGRLDMAPSMPSKLNTFVQICLISLLIIQLSGLAQVSGWFPLLFGLVVGAALISGGHYVAVWGRKAELV
jgi:cardiolipin synthase (CMP-forming)